MTRGGESAVFISHAPHPTYAGLRLVIWRMHTGPAASTWSLDALLLHQEIGDILPTDRRERWQRVQEAFRG